MCIPTKAEKSDDVIAFNKWELLIYVKNNKL